MRRASKLIIVLSISVIYACGGSGGDNLALDPNAPDPSFMAGAIAPDPTIGQTKEISYFDLTNNYRTVTAEEKMVTILFDQNISSNAAELIITQSGGTVASKIPASGLYLAKVSEAKENDFIHAVKGSDSIILVDPNSIIFANEAIQDPVELSQYSNTERKHLDLIRAPEAWSLVESKFKTNVSKSVVTMGIMDVCFKGSPHGPAGEHYSNHQFVNDVPQLQVTGENIACNNSHGFLVSSLAAAQGNNDKKPIGINWYSKVRGVKVMRLYTLLYEVTRLIYEEGLEVINISLGPVDANNNGVEEKNEAQHYYKFFSDIQKYLNKLPSDKSFLVVVSAGNDNIYMNWPELKHPRLVVVGNYENLSKKALYSNHGALVDIYVPATENGFPFYFTDKNGVVDVIWKSGTSFGAPVFTGVASLLWDIDKSLAPTKVKELIISNSYSIGQDRILNMYAAIDALAKLVPSPNSNTDSVTTNTSESQPSTATTSNDMNLTPTDSVPNTPINFSASAQSTSSISLSWQSGGGGLKGYKLERSLDGISFTQIADVSKTITSYLDLNLKSFTTYYYRVNAYKNNGESGYATTFAKTLEAVPNPTLAASLSLTQYSYSVHVSGNYAYVTDGTYGLKIIDVSNPTSPQQVGSYNTPGYAKKVFASGNYAYVADSGSGLQIINISNKTSPTLTGSYDTPGNCISVVVNGNYAYLADGNEGIKILNISNPASPSLVGSLNIGDYASDLQVSGNYAYIAANGGLKIVNISTPSSPTLTSSFATVETVYSLCVSGNNVYLANSYTGLQIINVSTPSSPQSVGTYITSDEALCVYVYGSYAYVGTYAGTLETVKISNPSNITLVKSVQLDDIVWGVFQSEVSGSDYLFLAAAGRGLKILSK